MADTEQQEEVYVEEQYTQRVFPKRIIILCDGTSQSAVSGKKSSPSNVARLARSLNTTAIDKDDPNKEWLQIVWYDSGVATTSGKVGKVVEGVLGSGLEGNVIEAYNFVALNYSPGDQIFCFGFSRGAYTARAIAGLISDIGICGREYLHEFPELWAIYTDKEKRKAGERFCGSQAYFDFIDGDLADQRLQPDEEPEFYNGYNYFELNWNQKPHFWMEDPNRFLAGSRKVEVVGVYDTVGSLGMPGIRHYHPFGNGPDFHNVEMNRNIRRAFHALALDEHRDAFSPTLYSVPAEIKKSQAEEVDKQREVVEQLRSDWFRIVPSKKATPQEKAAVRKKYVDARRILLELEENSLDGSELKQVWFPGVHINIGGGSNDTLETRGDLEQTANIVFAWMLDHISDHLGIDVTQILSDNFKIKELVTEHNHRVRLAELTKKLDEEAARKESWAQATWRLGKYIGSVVSSPFSAAVNDKILPEPGWATGDYVDSYTLKYKANGSTPRTPGDYNKDPKKLTNEEVHPTVGYRLKALGDKYRPLDNKVSRNPTKDGQGWEYVINGIVLPEYKISPPPDNVYGNWSYERLVITQDAKQYVKEVDKSYGYPGWDLEPMMPSYNRTFGEGAVL
ncbi:hypothetical protein TWF730_010096 [Orbilia blumenaviensis]|uniref:T6SS Phospholipase effector Tle1-like catalytic domain-containing protein n=1 Tax=Orbilia blumenaviensis TaxID=1796055 RepID=A0AAV9UV41_9PEZI